VSRRANAGARRAAGLCAAGALLAGCGGATATGAPTRTADPSLVAAARLTACPPTSNGPVDGGLPSVRLPCVGGGTVDLAGLRGPALVNLWWSGCAPCRAESPLLQHVAAAARGRLTVLGVDVEDPDPGLRFAIDHGLRYAMASDPHERVKDAGLLPGFPVTYFVDRSGRRVGTHAGGYATAAALRADLRRYLKVDAP
jgi:cytochrome c biogenesis protein CcmG, thiol:disulfide interchange protein DsbE